PSYTDDNNNPWNLVPTYQSISSNGTIGEKSFIETPDDNTNLFAKFSTSFLAVYFMLTGDTSAVSSWVLQNNLMLSFLLVTFLFFTTIYLLNLFISLLSMTMEKKEYEEIYLRTKAEILSEIELFWMLPHQRRKKNWFPESLKYVKKLEDEQNDEILQDLLPAIKEIVKAKDSTKDSAEDLPYDLIAQSLP
ncbi:25012_t:CDS:2, partial [Racocetra persica]